VERKPLPETLTLKRQVTVKTRVTDRFRQEANQGLSQELGLIDDQLRKLEADYHTSVTQLEKMGGPQAQGSIQQLQELFQQKHQQLSALKAEVSNQLGNLEQVPNGTVVVTGMLESEVSVTEGDHIYRAVRGAELIVEDGVIVQINT
jgi:hypothetical protein